LQVHKMEVPSFPPDSIFDVRLNLQVKFTSLLEVPHVKPAILSSYDYEARRTPRILNSPAASRAATQDPGAGFDLV